MTKVLYKTPGVPTEGDPLGTSPDADPTPTLVAGELVGDNGDGTFVVAINGALIQDADEGTGIRQFQSRSGLTRAMLQTLEQDLQTWEQDTEAEVVMAARAVRAANTRHDPVPVGLDLRAAVNNGSLPPMTRALALLALGIVVAEERRRT